MSAVTLRWPNFFIVGAAKAGTTSMHRYLAQHPDVFMSPVKEPTFFASDLGLITPWQTEQSYLSLFADADGRAVRGESSPAYLLSSEAARRIREVSPDARILILLRNPVDAAHAVFREARKFALEPCRRFATALAASDDGRPDLVGRPGGTWLRYREVVRYADQVERYLRAFPRDQVLVLLYDELAGNPASVYRRVLEFAGVDPSFQARLDRSNPGFDVRSQLVQRWLMAGADRERARGSTTRPGRFVARLNRRSVVAADPATRTRLLADLRPDIERLAELIDRDLSRWLDATKLTRN